MKTEIVYVRSGYTPLRATKKEVVREVYVSRGQAMIEAFLRGALRSNPPNADTALRIFARYLVSKGKDESKESWQSRVEAQVVAWKTEYAVVKDVSGNAKIVNDLR